MGAIASQITSLTIVYSTVYSDADQRKHQSSASVAFVWGIHRGPVNSPHKWPVTRKMFPFDDVFMILTLITSILQQTWTQCTIRDLYLEVCLAQHKKYTGTHGLHSVVFCCGLVLVDFNHILQGCFTDTGYRVPKSGWEVARTARDCDKELI